MQNELEKGILRYVDSSIENAPYTQIYTGLIKTSGVDGYTIDLNGVEYTNVPSEGSFSTNDTVKVVIPNNQPSNMFILAESTGGGGTGAVSSVNGMTGDVVISNVSSADKLSSAKTITLTGDATGSVSTDLSTSPTISVTVVDDSHNHIISNVDNLQTTLNVKADLVDGKVPSSQLPSFVDDVLEYATLLAFPVTGTSGVIYVDLSTNLAYRWSGTAYVEISPSLALGETSSTAYRGDRGVISYNHSLSTSNPHSTTASQVGLGSVDNTSDATKKVLSATKLTTARTISLNGDITGSVNTDFSSNPSINTTSRKIVFVGSDVANSNGWYKVAEQTMSGYGNTNITFMVTSTFRLYQYGILELQMRSDNTSIYCQTFDWMTKKGFFNSDFIIVINGMKWSMYVYQNSGRYGRICFEILSMSNERSKNMSWNLTLENNLIKETIIPIPTVMSTENSIVGYSNKLTTARTISLSGDVTGSVSFDGSANVSITSTVADDSHNHVISNVDNLQTTLDSKLNSSAYNATDVLTKIKTVDGSGSGLDADTVDTYHVNNMLNTGSLWTSDKILSTVETYGSHFDIVQYRGTYAVNDILTMTVPTITSNKSNGIEVLLYRNSAYESALLGIDYIYKYTSATQIQVQFFTAGTYIANYGFYNVGSWILEWQ